MLVYISSGVFILLTSSHLISFHPNWVRRGWSRPLRTGRLHDARPSLPRLQPTGHGAPSFGGRNEVGWDDGRRGGEHTHVHLTSVVTVARDRPRGRSLVARNWPNQRSMDVGRMDCRAPLPVVWRHRAAARRRPTIELQCYLTDRDPRGRTSLPQNHLCCDNWDV